MARAVPTFRRTIVLRAKTARGDASPGEISFAEDGDHAEGDVIATLPPAYPEWLGDRAFQEIHGVRFPYVMGSMANGIATPRLVIAAARGGMLAFFGAAGLAPSRVEAAIDEIARSLGNDGRVSWGANLIHSPQEPELEKKITDLYIQRGVSRIEASAFMELNANVVRLACNGLRVDADGFLVRRHHVLAKISRTEVAREFMSPAPAEMLRALVASGDLTAEEAALASRVPVASDVTVESDSGGHTDNRPLVALLPAILAVRDEVSRAHDLAEPIRVGAAGGLGSPAALAAAFALGAAYVLTGSVNQGAVESGLSDDGKRMLATADMTDVAMASAADMFEMGVKVQVLKRGSFFAMRANKLYELYRAHESLEDLPEAARTELETKIVGAPIDVIWAETQRFWRARNPAEIDRAATDGKHKMALIFRWYLGKSSRWAIDGDPSRRADYQIWCGPAMGAFNAWVKGSFLEPAGARTVVQIALNLLEGAATITRAHQLRTFGAVVPASAFRYSPTPLAYDESERQAS